MSNNVKIALVTGGSRGLGKNMALRLAESGKDVILTYHTQQAEADAVAAEIEAMGRRAVALRLDVGQVSSFEAFFAQVQTALSEKFGAAKFDYLVNNAGVGATLPFGTVTEADFDRLLNIHFKGVYFLTQKALPLMADGGGILNISTGTTRFCIPGYSVYASAKGAVETFTRYLAKELGARGINANVLAPGAIETDFNGAAIRNNPQLKAYLGSITALGRVGEADDIGGVVAALCSDACRWINGQRIEASGGMML
jgi:NAD(P)-dependent dehydrogenase (short-subunit alcohol dehydrogenase family)